MRDRYPSQLSGGQRQRVGVARALAVDPPIMLMDEPFGAIDPIQRERLQNEFLRLQAELRKTIVFVTHDIDEAIKMGDRIAVLQVGGKLAQYAPPAELLTAPANPFVEDFVGADRALKRLALQRVRDIDLWTVATCRAGEATGEVRARIADADLDIPLLVDAERRPLGWLSERGLTGERVRPELRSPAEPIVELDDILRDALSDLLARESMYGPVVDAGGHVVGALSIQAISHAIGHAKAEVAGAAERVDAAPEPAEPDPSHGRRSIVIATVIAQSGGFLRDRTGDTGCPSNDGFCLELDAGPPRPLPGPVLRARLCSASSRRRSASRSRCRWACSPTASAGSSRR